MDIFGDWLLKLNNKMTIFNRHILLLLDNAGGHNVTEEVIKENLDRKHKVLKTVFFDLDKVDPAMLAALEGTSIVVLDFWATWLPICRETIPVLSDIQKKYSGDGENVSPDISWSKGPIGTRVIAII